MPEQTFETLFAPWAKLDKDQQKALGGAARLRKVKAGTVLHNGGADCLGFILVRTGQLRAYFLSAEGREITLYRLFERDACLLAASCMMASIQFEVTIEAEKDTDLWDIPAQVYQGIMAESAPVANYTNELMASRFSDVMWLVEQILWRSQDRRLASFLLDESALQESRTLAITHDRIAAHMGTAREVVTRLLRYFQGEGMVRLAEEMGNRVSLRFLKEGDNGWLTLHLTDVGLQFRVYLVSSPDYAQLVPFGRGEVAATFTVKFHEPQPTFELASQTNE